MTTLWLEDFEVGAQWTSDPYKVSEEQILAFGREYDPQPIHTDPKAGAASRFGTVIASGWMTAALSMRLFVEAGGYGQTPVIGLGIDELRWKGPVRPGDTLRVLREVIDVRRSNSRPDYGVVRTRVSMVNQRDEEVMSLISSGQIPARRNRDRDAAGSKSSVPHRPRS